VTDVPRIRRNDWSSLTVPSLGQWRPTRTVSVVIPAYNCQPSLDLTLASLTRQTYPAELTEVVVVDDGSDPPLALPQIRPENCRLVRAGPQSGGWGAAHAVRVGVEHSAGEVIQRLDADLVAFPEHLEAHARWHCQVPYAVTLGSKRFVDVAPSRDGWPSPAQVATAPIEGLFSRADGEPHDYIEAMLRTTDQLRSADHLAFLAHVGATVGLRRELYEAAGGPDASLRLGEDTEFGYRLAQAGAVFVPDRQAQAWHLGRSHMMREAAALRRYNRPYLADAMPHPRWLRRRGGSGWAVPLVTVVIPIEGYPLELVRTAVDAVLDNDERDIRVCLVAGWPEVPEQSRPVLADPRLDLRLVAATYRSDPRVRLVDAEPRTAFPSPYLLTVPVTVGLGRSAIRRLVDEADRHRAGLARLATPAGTPIELTRTAAIGRARWVRRAGEPLSHVVAETHGVRSLAATDVATVDLGRVPPDRLASGVGDHLRNLPAGRWLPPSVEVAGIRSLARAALLVARLAAGRIRTRLARSFAPARRVPDLAAGLRKAAGRG
jgi:glycosyltransferase involved in cell wall biosynthesis